MANIHDIQRDEFQLFGKQARLGYDWWWHSLTAHDAETGEGKAFFIEFFTCNPDLGSKKPVFGQLPGTTDTPVKPSYVMVKAGAWGADGKGQLHRFFGWHEIRLYKGAPFELTAGDCYVTETHTNGHIVVSERQAEEHPEWMSDAGEMSWNLEINKQVAFNVGYGASSPMRRKQWFEMFWHAEGMKTAYQGEIIWNGRRYIVEPDTCYGYADKNWGKGFTTPWVWLSSCDLVSEITGRRLTDSVFDIGGGKPKIGPLVLDRKLLADFWYEGRDYEFNFSKPWTGCRTKFNCYETDTHIVWHVEQSTWKYRMITDITCKKEDMIWVNYEAPNGEKRHKRLWNGGNGTGTVELYCGKKLIDRVRAEHVGCEYGEYDVTEPYSASSR
ncbi:MAG: hypothetical protein MJZ82_02240 [Paludibacteraceae bacterium]|nr:hypothetical protein [Paludibacteraceae bacterium]